MESIKTKKLFMFIFIFVISIIFISCKSDNADTNKTENAKEETNNSEESVLGSMIEEIKDSLPEDLDFGGETLNLLVEGDVGAYEQFYVEEESGDLYNDAVFIRNRTLEERLNMKLNVIIGATWENWVSQTQKKIKASIAAGDMAYDLIGEWSGMSTALMLEGLYMDVRKLPYIDLSRPWWNKSMLEEGEIGGRLLFAAGDLTPLNLTGSLVYYFNKKLRQEYDIPDLYQTVIDGKWTNDYMLQITKDISKDLNGDGIMDENDLFGAGLSTYNAIVPYHCSSQVKMTSKDENGMIKLTPDHEKINAVIDYLHQFLFENKGAYTVRGEGDLRTTQDNMFKNDQLLFYPYALYGSYGIFRDMQTDYGILPFPKFDEKQDGYYTRLWADFGTFMCIPNNCGKQELVGAFLEAAAFENHKNVIPTLYEKALKVKFMRDDMSAKILDIIREGIYFNFDVIYVEKNAGIAYIYSSVINDKNGSYASWYEKNEAKIEKAIADIMEKIKALD